MSGGATMVDVVNHSLGEALGHELGPDLIARTAQADGASLLTLRHAYDEYRMSWRAPARPRPGALSPYVPTYSSTMPDTGGVDLRTEYDFTDTEKIQRSVEALYLQLLYAHRVAVTNPFIYVHDRLRWFPGDDSEYFPEIRSMVVGYLTFLSQVSQLVMSGTLVLVEDEQSTFAQETTDETAPILHNDGEVAALLDFEDFGLERGSAEELAKLREGAWVPLEEVVYMTEVSGRHDFVFDYFFSRRQLHLKCLKWLVANSRRPEFAPFWSTVGWPDPGQHAGESDLLNLQKLGSIAVPDFDLSARDIIAVREDDAFEVWRRHLGRALDAISESGSESLFGAAPEFGILSSELAEGREDLQRLLKSSSFLTAARSGLRTMTVGALAALLAAPVASPLEGIAVAGATGAVEVALDLKKVRQKGSKRALLNHYLLFSEPA